jgi:ABC-2 type transport system permease protein
MISTIAAKELKTLFASPLAWIVLTALQLITAYAFLKRLDDFLQVQPQLVQLASPPGVTELVIAPLFATAAIVLLLSMTQLVLGKFLGLVVFLALTILLVVAMPLTLSASTDLDYGLLASMCLGLLLLAAGFAALSLYISSLTTYPVAAAFGAFAALLIMILVSEAAGDATRARGWHVPGALVQVFSPLKNFEPLGKGLIDSFALVCSILMTVVFLVLTVRRLDAQRLRG